MTTKLLYGREIQLCDYDEKESVLTIGFKNGITKQYYGVPKVLFQNLMKAAAKNHYYSTEIEGLYRVK